MVKKLDRVQCVVIGLTAVILFAIIICFVTMVKTNDKKPCETFLPDSSHIPGHQCWFDKRAYLKIYENGNALCVCKDLK